MEGIDTSFQTPNSHLKFIAGISLLCPFQENGCPGYHLVYVFCSEQSSHSGVNEHSASYVLLILSPGMFKKLCTQGQDFKK